MTPRFDPLTLEKTASGVTQLWKSLEKGFTPVLLNTYWSPSQQIRVANRFLGQTPPSGENLVVFTSGSTGEPKPCVLSIEALCINARLANERLSLQNSDRWWLSLPLFHVGGLGILFRTKEAGAKWVENENEANIVSFVPTQLYRLVRSFTQTSSNIGCSKTVLLGGAPCPPSLIEQGLELGLEIFRTYGMTETASQITATRAKSETSENLKYNGFPLSSVEVRIKNGNIEVKTPSLMKGYWSPEGLELPLSDDWFVTPDQGEMTKNGLRFIGRRDRVFQSGGENIQPEKIESLLLSLAGVLQARVEPRPDPEYGFRPIAYLDTVADFNPSQLEPGLKTLSGLERPVELLPWADYKPTSFKQL